MWGKTMEKDEYFVFHKLSDQELRTLYDGYQEWKEKGDKPEIFNTYIEKIKVLYRVPGMIAWEIAKRLFLEEVADRFFASLSLQGESNNE